VVRSNSRHVEVSFNVVDVGGGGEEAVVIVVMVVVVEG
jgi:hypothetical protein